MRPLSEYVIGTVSSVRSPPLEIGRLSIEISITCSRFQPRHFGGSRIAKSFGLRENWRVWSRNVWTRFWKFIRGQRSLANGNSLKARANRLAVLFRAGESRGGEGNAIIDWDNYTIFVFLPVFSFPLWNVSLAWFIRLKFSLIESVLRRVTRIHFYSFSLLTIEIDNKFLYNFSSK